MSILGSVEDMEATQKVNPRPVTFDLMSDDPDYYFVLTEALRDFAARERAEAEDYPDNAAARIRWAETAEDALWRIEMALSGNPRP
jgi:hypothetical protein